MDTMEIEYSDTTSPVETTMLDTTKKKLKNVSHRNNIRS